MMFAVVIVVVMMMITTNVTLMICWCWYVDYVAAVDTVDIYCVDGAASGCNTLTAVMMVRVVVILRMVVMATRMIC